MLGSSAHLVETYYRITPEKFHLLKFILEGYDNLAVLSSMSGKTGLIRLKCAHESLPELISLLAAVAPYIKQRRL
ncbi:MAG: DUF4911 domain-containing protein [Desulfofustis sp.]|jgi:hypothetical protein|nr:DUF4911 domain-containing protein [Desulfofustis sp.]